MPPLTVRTRHDTPFTLDWITWAPRERAVLTFVRQQGQILLIRKKRGLGAGKYNAPGGRIEPGETAAAAAVRETREELCLTPTGICPAGELSFAFVDGYSLHCQVFTADGSIGTATETDEAVPHWCAETEIPYDRMWADDRLWLPRLLAGIPFSGRFVFDGDQMIWHDLT
jgi:8-oxo-dGTP diphosphatase